MRDYDPAQAGMPQPSPLRSMIAHPAGMLRYLAAATAIAVVYFVAAKASLALASINPSATPIWPPTGLALAVLLLGGYRFWPAIFVGAVVANALTAGSIYTSLTIGVGNLLEGMVGAYLINRWSGGAATFDTPAGVGRFAALCLFPSTAISATVGVLSLLAGGYAEPSAAVAIWLTWWMGDVAGALLITPVIVLAARTSRQWLDSAALARSLAVFGVSAAIGLVAFSPLSRSIPNSGALAFVALVPLMWSALYRQQLDTAITAVILAAFAVWGTATDSGPFTRTTLNDSFLLLLAFMISVSVPSLALSANVAVYRRHEQHIDSVMMELSHRTKNLLSVVQSIARQTARHSRSFDVFDTAFSDRIQALAHIHDLLVAREWQGANIRDVVSTQLAPFLESNARRLTAHGPELMLNPRAVEQIGLVLHELATNATKYGSLSAENGSVLLHWALETDNGAEPRFRIEWQERGGPAVSPPERNGFGHLVVTQLVPRTLNGEASLDFGSDGVRWSLVAPVAHLIPSERSTRVRQAG